MLDTLQSLIVAFVLAMTFRGFVTEGFVIPTGSMAPTLMGQHVHARSPQTGYEYPVDARPVLEDRARERPGRYPIVDPMLGPGIAVGESAEPRVRMGDRILVLKCLYPFRMPQRFDVVVFKNPTDPDGESENYIKRLIGLPGESIWLVDGDVFAAGVEDAERWAGYRVQRKPEHVQRAVWQAVYESDYIPADPEHLAEIAHRPGLRFAPPWTGDGWQTESVRRYRCDSAGPTELRFEGRPITDRTAYNALLSGVRFDEFPVCDVRVRAGIVADGPGLSTTLELEARGHLFSYTIAGGRATMRLEPLPGHAGTTDERSAEVRMPEPGRVCNVEFWHVDQSMSIYVDGERVGEPLEYPWDPVTRIGHAYSADFEDWKDQSPGIKPHAPRIRWRFQGAPLALERVGVDRDIYYQPRRNHGGHGFGTHPDHLARLGPEHYFMLGDNSPASQDSRVWGRPHPLVAVQIDEAPFVVNRRLLLGKAWVVYFPAPYPLGERGPGVIPDFGRLRFIR